MHKTIFLDTNVFLHYQPFDQIDWLEIVKVDSATIVIPPVTIRELNKHKDSHPRAHLRKRAGVAIKRISGLFDSGSNATIRENIRVSFEDRDPTIDFAAYNLNPNIQDDHLIASIVMKIQEAPDDHVVLVTSDLGLTLLSKARRQGIDTLRLPDNLQIADEPDPNENRVKQLEQQLRELNARVPNLSLTYQDGSQHFAFKLARPATLDQSDVDRMLSELKQKFPHRNKPDVQDHTDLSLRSLKRMSSLATSGFSDPIPQAEFDRYNKEVEAYFAAYPEYMAKRTERENLERRTVRLNVLLANDGTTPAEDIDVYMHFPDGFRLLQEHELPSPISVPDPPAPPMTQMQQMAHSIESLQRNMYPASLLFNSHNSGEPPPNVSGPHIKRVNSYDVRFHIQKVKHNLAASLVPLFVVFDSFDSGHSFTIQYQILAANVPHEITGKLHVVIENRQP